MESSDVFSVMFGLKKKGKEILKQIVDSFEAS